MGGSHAEPVAATPLLETKLFAPRWRPGSVARPRLLARLNRGAQSRLTLVSAPAGFGKTALLAEWLASDDVRERPLAWLSLDRGDSQPTSFWTYLVAALQSVRPGIGRGTLALLQPAQSARAEDLLGGLLNELAALPDELTLVLEDYHMVEGITVHEGVAFLLEHLPPTVHLVITSRSDPPLPLARLRARGDLVEVRASDLRFTAEEAASFLNGAMGLTLSAEDVVRLDTRAEGWIAGLQLAALSMQGRDDVDEFIAAFTGNDRYIVDYLVEEVLERQPEDVRRFLLATSILDRLGGPLCDAVTGGDGGAAMLARLERSNLFVVPLDDRRQWYRYHHLFGDVLQAHLREAHPDEVAALHRRASRWCEEHGDLPTAIHHALAGGDFERAATQVELAVPLLQRTRQERTLRGWIEALPTDVRRRRPVLGTSYASVLLTLGELNAVEPLLREVDAALDAAEPVDRESDVVPAGPAFVDERQLRSLPGMVAVYRAGLAQVRGDLPGTMEHARLALEQLPEDDELGRGAASALLGLALQASGDLERAHRTYEAGMARVREAGYVPDVIASTISLAEMRMGQGRLREAEATYQRALRYASEQAQTTPLGTADLHVGMSGLCLERNELDLATQHLAKSRELGEGAALHEHRHRWFVAMAGVRRAQGDAEGALDLLAEAERVHRAGFLPDVRPIAALRANTWVRGGRLADAVAWAAAAGLTVDDDVTYRREFEHLTLARILLAQGRAQREPGPIEAAGRLLDRLLRAADESGRDGSALQVLVVQALARDISGDLEGALGALGRALASAEPEGYVRVFVDEGQPMRDLLRRAAGAGMHSAYTRRLLSAFEGGPTSTPTAKPTPSGLPEPLTARELEVLRLVAAGLTNQEIADQLVVTLATVKRHIANSYGKLGVGHRTEAVARANALDLL